MLVSGAHGGHSEHILWCFQWFSVKLMLRIFDFAVLLFGCFYHQNVTCLKRFTMYRHYASEVEDVIIARLAVVS